MAVTPLLKWFEKPDGELAYIKISNKMNAKNQSEANTTNEPNEGLIFDFSESKQKVQTIFAKDESWFVAKDICIILGLSNVTKSLSNLDNDEKLTLPLVRSGQIREVNCVNESGLYNLIFKSRKKEAKSFRKWVTKDVLPNLRKKGYYAMHQKQKNDFIDARDIPFYTKPINGYNVRCIDINGIVWVVINDANKAIHSSTSSNQLAKKLNARQYLAQKIWLFGNTHPAWCTNELGLQLLLAGSRKFSNQLNLSI
tara:strand:- start:243 stop:1004 length:762 start_codon:yes stop_codon:yes gene_type:complete